MNRGAAENWVMNGALVVRDWAYQHGLLGGRPSVGPVGVYKEGWEL
jgi:hypothetical protein